MNQHDLFEQLHALRRSLVKILPQLPACAEDWRPRENMRSCWELANHLVSIPATDTVIAQEKDQPAVQAKETGREATTVEGLDGVWDQGMEELIAHYSALPPDQFESLETTSFYGHKAVAKTWLVETVTHVHHHRAQLFTYLKLMGRPVDMFYLYS